MTTTQNLTYADLAAGATIVSTQTGELAEIRWLNRDGTQTIKIIDGPDAGEYQSLFPSELLTFWRATR